MTQFFEWLMNFFREFKFLITVLPWEGAVRVRLGKHVKQLDPGMHIRLPFVDQVQTLNSRLRIADTGTQTLTTSDGHVLTVSLNAGFNIADPLAAMLKMQSPENSVAAISGSLVASLVSKTPRASLSVELLENHISRGLASQPYQFEFVRVRDFAYAKAFRLLNENNYRSAAVHIEERKI